MFESFKRATLRVNPETRFINRKRPIIERAIVLFREGIAKRVKKILEGHKWLSNALAIAVNHGISRLAYRRTMELTNIECRMCGVCCERLSITELDFKKDAGERCPKLTDDNLCSIFEDRPSVCRDWPNLEYSRVRYDPFGLLIEIDTCPIVREWWANLSFVLTGRRPSKYRIIRLDGTREGRKLRIKR